MNTYIITLILLITPYALHGATLHALLIGDSHDDILGEAIIEDMNHMHKAVKKIANITKLSKNEIQLCGSQATRKNVLQEIKQLHVGPDDVVIAYFTMHGYRNESKSSRWPDLFFGEDDAGADLNFFSAALSEKNPRLLIVLADCCNVYVKPGEISSTWRLKTHVHHHRLARGSTIKNNYERLFLGTAGVIIASGSEPGEPSYGSDEEGSLFTLAFVDSLELVAEDEEQASWEEVFEEIEEYIEEETDEEDGMDEPQTPQYKLHIHYH